MAFHDDLLKQANHLARLDRGRPKQANLRRAVSTAYYALFHLLIAECVRNWKVENQRATLARAFEHGRMKNACLRRASLNVNLKAIAQAFVELQSARHKADYDGAVQWTRVDAIATIAIAEMAFRKWELVRGHDAAQDLLLSLPADRK